MPPSATHPEPNTTTDGAAGQRRALVLLAVVALIWALELFAFQALSFDFGYPVPLAKQIGAHAVRLMLDLLFSVGLVFLLPRVLTVVAFLIFALFTQVAGYYQQVFGRVLSWTTMQAQFTEGVEGAGFDWSYLHWPLLLAALAVFAVKVGLLLRVKRPAGYRGFRRTGVTVGVAAIVGYLVLVGVAMWKIDRPTKLRSFATVDRFGMTYGYLPTWVSEWVYLDMDHLLREAVAQRSLKTDRLSELESPIELTGDVVLVQVESLDWRVLRHRVEGREVTPYLNRLIDEAMLFNITAIHSNGSGDTDFIMLCAVPPSPTVMTYALKDYPYTRTLPQLAAEAGYQSVMLHGNAGRFFLRREAFSRMPFSRLLFLEEMRDELGAPTSLWGVRDDAVFDISSDLIDRSPDQRQLHYIITLTSHQPFIYLEPEQRTFLPDEHSLAANYFNSIHFVDRQLERYIGGLPAGTLVVLFGDHRAAVTYDTGKPNDDRPEHVPLIIHRVGDRLADRQVSRSQVAAVSGELTLLDAASYIHRLFEPPPAR